MFYQQVNSTIKRYQLVGHKETVLLGVSGGPDSVALAYAFHSLQKNLTLTLHIAHLDHMLRRESGHDAQFVETLGRRLNIPVTVKRVAVKRSTQNSSLEEAGRRERLRFFFNVAKQIKADKIALGHTLDDQAETVLMRILRGAGLHGLSAIAPKRYISGFCIIRPLIEVKRADIERFLKKKRITACRDSSNSKNIFLRNRLRNTLIPALAKDYNRNIKEALANLAETVSSDYDYLAQSAQKQLTRMPSATRLNVQKLKNMHIALQRIVLRTAITRLKGDTRRIDFQHIKEIEDLLHNRPENSIVDLPQGICVIKNKSCLHFCSKQTKT
ncbi:MAG: tRNA lysidine(34) synthetase TilS [Candidatus Omnitrophica bacterium]|nr:tRNA lysidine(34) synthetase TilS [Candidatus Omnitrophota bacterium]